ncbi:hypothetical protein HanXRQr2_Chr13g0607731 [Helianthus annuus]|uniref:Uncharacterized protein n=1 Tax=Helianthus annuus TaxID=4232 RepID=A0A9K3EKH3_HELAN|nr:hypothetical protein HanXRQr2_Chr13g0607731 [Helianthus annuus]KAJ0850885.1 hypothetical protein HanPSC8_Chr13g0586011 [Helianthus annuus]
MLSLLLQKSSGRAYLGPLPNSPSAHHVLCCHSLDASLCRLPQPNLSSVARFLP